jgi:hypothetical protein
MHGTPISKRSRPTLPSVHEVHIGPEMAIGPHSVAAVGNDHRGLACE